MASGANGLDDPQMHFIISAPRSGATWLSKTLNGHPKIFCTENRLFGEFCEIWPNPDGSMSPRITFDEYLKQLSGYFHHSELGLNRVQFRERFQKSYLRFLTHFCQRQSGKSIIVDKVTPYLNSAEKVMERINKYFPASQTIQLIRDGRDVVTSGTFDWLQRDAHGTDRYSYFVEKRPGIRMRRFFDDKVLTTWTKHWIEPIESFGQEDQGLTIRYESMKENQNDVLKMILNRLDCDFDDETLRSCVERATFEKMSGRSVGDDREPLAKTRRGVAGDWRNYFTQRDGQLFHEIAGKTLVDLGYASDSNWWKSLPEELEYVLE